jgi:hypothetical protein
MAFFGSSWFENDDDNIGPFSHWLEDGGIDDTNLCDEDDDEDKDEDMPLWCNG